MAFPPDKHGHSEAPAHVHLPTVVADLGATQHPDAYGGLTAKLARPEEPSSITMTIYVVAARAEPFLAAVRTIAEASPDTRYRVAHVPHSWAELNDLAQEIEDAGEDWRTSGVMVAAADPDAATSKVVVTVLDYDASAAHALTAAYGGDWITVRPSTARYVPLGGKARRSGGPLRPMSGRRTW